VWNVTIATPLGKETGRQWLKRLKTNSDLNEGSSMAFGEIFTREISKYDLILECGTEHICTQRDAFIDYFPLSIGPVPGKGTILVHMSVNSNTNYRLENNGAQNRNFKVFHRRSKPKTKAPNIQLIIPTLDRGGSVNK